MKVGNNKVVSLVYELREDDANGDLIQKVEKESPFVHLFGVGSLLPAFEHALEGLVAGDSFSFGIPAAGSYGEHNPEVVYTLEKSMFEIDGVVEDGLLEIGNQITMQDQDGNPVDGIVLDVTNEGVVMDFNHPLAGINLYFTGKVLEVRDATAEELAHGHVHGPHGHHH